MLRKAASTAFFCSALAAASVAGSAQAGRAASVRTPTTTTTSQGRRRRIAAARPLRCTDCTRFLLRRAGSIEQVAPLGLYYLSGRGRGAIAGGVTATAP